jgi:hypothetical protein
MNTTQPENSANMQAKNATHFKLLMPKQLSLNNGNNFKHEIKQ